MVKSVTKRLTTARRVIGEESMAAPAPISVASVSSVKTAL